MLTVMIHKVTADIDTVFSNRIVGMLPLLKERVVEVVGEEGKQAIEKIEAWVDESLEDDPESPPPPAQVFYVINRLLPTPYRVFPKTVREVAGVGPKAGKVATRVAFMKNPSKGRLLEEVFLLPPEMLAKGKYCYISTIFNTNGLVLSLLWIDTTSKPRLPDRKVEDAINLPNNFSNKSLQSSHQDAWIIALDPGATCIARAVAFDPNPDQRRNLAVTTKYLAEPERRYRNWQEANKPEVISTAERTNKHKRKRWDADKAKRGELDRVLEGIVNMVDESMGHKLSDDKKVIVSHRYVMAVDNMVNIVRGYLEHDERPAYLKPPSKDKNTPMKRKADEGGTSRAGQSKSRKTR
ncbi:hypothetical protein SeLEV6574_g02016 [Synchytrium endobioticum]|uniref:Uncharacterized protein n=1 Tax=Synchytrium endobioticum TaxID=286115 RepID=A0A507DC89_9FUNG|nr:hypothetical protein SeLEV6574_g02016 [Synchytrium endobioticum]